MSKKKTPPAKALARMEQDADKARSHPIHGRTIEELARVCNLEGIQKHPDRICWKLCALNAYASRMLAAGFTKYRDWTDKQWNSHFRMLQKFGHEKSFRRPDLIPSTRYWHERLGRKIV